MAGYSTHFSLGNKLRRFTWQFAWLLLMRLSPRPCFGWRRFVLRAFGARVGQKARVYPTTRVWGPWNLDLGNHCVVGPDVDLYCMDLIRIGDHATVSQYSYLCTGTHDIEDPHMNLITAPICVENSAWICADVFIGPGVVVGEGAVVGARSSVFKNVESWIVVAGAPARRIKTRVLREAHP